MDFQKWFKDGLPVLSELISKSRTINENEKTIQFSGFMLEEFVEIIRSGLVKSSFEIGFTKTAINKTLFDYELIFPLELNNLKAVLKKNIENARGPETTYVIVSGFYLEGSLSFKKIKMPEAFITFYSANPAKLAESSVAKFLKNQEVGLPQDFGGNKLEAPYHQVITKAFVKARSVEEAAAIGSRSLDQFRGLLNYCFNARRISNISIGRRSETRVFNGVVGFRYFTVHDQEGNLLPTGVYYTRLWDKPRKVARLRTANERVIPPFLVGV